MPSGRITMYDVARQAGVSLMTVSRVINHNDHVSPATRQRILAIIEELGYRPSSLARGLATHQTGTLGLVVPDIDNPFFSGMARGTEYQAYTQGNSVLLGNASEDPAREIAVIRSFEDKGVDGLILCSSRLNDPELCQVVERFPAVVLVSRNLPQAQVGEVLIDDEAGGRLAAEHLLARGHSRIGFLSGPPISHSSRHRVRGYQQVLQSSGLAVIPELIRYGSSTVEGGYRSALMLLAEQAGTSDLQTRASTERPTALICHNDLVAVGVLQACAELGLRVPTDLAVIGFDDIQLAALVSPPLTTLHVDRAELGAQAMRLLLDQIAAGTPVSRRILLKPELVVRGSAP